MWRRAKRALLSVFTNSFRAQMTAMCIGRRGVSCRGMPVYLPPAVKAALWSLDTERLDLEAHRERIVTNVLNLGTHEALTWLFATYPRERIAEVVAHPRPGEWNKRSLNFWSLVFGLEPRVTRRF